MQKNIVLCSDGTGNKGGQGDVTNVWRVFKAVDVHAHQYTINGNSKTLGYGKEQIAFHDDGVGTQNLKFLKMFGGAFGWGLSKNVRNLYLQLVRVYDPGDQIYLFGFSRGAFTVRTLAGLITLCGIVDRFNRYKNGNPSEIKTDEELQKLVKNAYKAYRKSYPRTTFDRFRSEKGEKKRLLEPGKDFKQTSAVKDKDHAPGGDIEIRFIGVWDTVDAVGLPFDELTKLLDLVRPVRFTDLKLSQHVIKASHAISIDDERRTFQPVMWDETGENGDRIEQVWFAGVHSNVGGGYPKQGMALVSLDWMIERARKAGLEVQEGEQKSIRRQANVDDKLYNSRAGLAVYYRYLPRNIQRISEAHGIDTPKIHFTVFSRIHNGTEGYAPGYIPDGFKVEITEQDDPPKWQGSNRLKDIKKVVSKCLRDNKEKVNRSRKLVRVRIGLNYAFIGVSLVLALGTFYHVPVFQNVDGALNWLGAIVTFLISPVDQLNDAAIAMYRANWALVWLPIGANVVVFVTSYIIRGQTRKLLQSMWNSARLKYQKILDKEYST